jgi:hypothetical protein
MNQEQIEAQAKAIMDAFLKELGSIEQEAQFGTRKGDQMRTPVPAEPNDQFRQAFFANAPNVKDNQLIMEKKQW